MTLPTYKELDSFVDITKIEEEIFVLQRSLFRFRFLLATRREVKPHLFVHIKRRIAQLKFKKSLIFKSKK